jgi:hypothetical protein
LICLNLRHYFDCREDMRDTASETAPHEHES